MKLFHSSSLKLGLSLLIALLPVLTSCSKKNPVESPPAIANLVLTPSHGAPGAAIDVTGITLDVTDLASYTLTIGGLETSITSDEFGAVSTGAPMFLDTATLWHAPPAAPLRVELLRNGTLVGEANAAFTSDALPAAPNTTQSIVTNLESNGQAFKDIMAALPLQPGIQEQIFFGLSQAIDSFYASENLQGLFDSLAATPAELALVDAVIASSGFDQTVASLSGAFADLALALAPPPVGSRASAASTYNDVVLSKMMQLASVLDDYAENFVHGVNTGLGDVGTGVSAASTISKSIKDLFDKIPLFDKMMTALSIGYTIADLMYAKFIVAGLPTRLDSITVTYNPGPQLAVGDTTSSIIQVFASSVPPAVNADDLLGLFLDLAGLAVKDPSKRDQYLAKLKTLLGFLKKALKQYKTDNPTFGYDPDIVDLFSIPKTEYHAVITDPDLLELKVAAGHPEIEPVQSLLEWRAADTGAADVWAEVMPAEISVNGLFFGFPVPASLTFNTTTFGDVDDDGESPNSTPITITVGRTLFVDDISFPQFVLKGTSATLSLTAGHIDASGLSVPEPGIDVALSVAGGFATPAQGLTDAGGGFTSDIVHTSEAQAGDSIEVILTVSDAGGEEFVDTLVAIIIEASEDKIAYVDALNSETNATSIYTVLAGGGARQLFLDDGSSPKWSVDKLRISFIRGGSEFILAPSGVVVDLSSGTGRAFSANWSNANPAQLVFVHSESGLTAYDDLTGVFTTLTVPHAAFLRNHRISPTGTQVMYNSIDTATESNLGVIMAVDLDGSNITTLVDSIVSRFPPELSWSGDGEDVVWTEPGSSVIWSHKLMAASTNGGQPRVLRDDGTKISNVKAIAGTREVVYGEDHVNNSGFFRGGIRVLNIDDLTSREIPGTSGLLIFSIAVSQDGLSLAILSKVFDANDRKIEVINLATGAKQSLITLQNPLVGGGPTFSTW